MVTSVQNSARSTTLRELIALVFAATIHEGYTTGVLVSSYELSSFMLLPT